MNNEFHKTVIINRAVPGSGKTTISKCITQALQEANLHVANHSTDEFFMRNGAYYFDIKKLNKYHNQNQKNFLRDLQAGTDVVICDNTNLQPWQTQPYTENARKYGYKILFLNLTPRSLEKHVQAQMVTAEKPDAHGVPEERLIEFIDDFNNYNVLLDKNYPVDQKRHFHFCWDDHSLCPVITGQARHFDLDEVVTVEPQEYHQAKLYIGKKFTEMIRKK